MKRSGETHIQKLVYLMLMKNKIPFGYEYILYDYGPWSYDLAKDIKFLEDAHLVRKLPDPSGFGFKYIPNEKFSDFAYDIFPKLLQVNSPIYGYVLKSNDYLIDIGTVEKYQKVNEDIKIGKLHITYEK